MLEFRLPDVGEGIHEATIAGWLVEVGDSVRLDQPIVEIETDKALVEIPAPAAGVIAEIALPQGTTAKVGDVLVVIDEAQNGAQAVSGQTPRKRLLAAPAVRKRALQLGIELAQVPGSAAAGRVTLDDLERFAAQNVPPAKPVPAPPALAKDADGSSDMQALQGLRKRIAERMQSAWRIPHVTSFDEIDVTRLVKLRKRINDARAGEQRLTYLPFIVKAVVQALQQQPAFNASLDMEKGIIHHHRQYHIGIATALSQGLVVPVLRDADALSLLALQVELNRLAALARERKLSPSELNGSTFTITNYGSFHGRFGTPIINPPESAILGCGRIDKKPAIKGRKIKARAFLPLALSFDHRLHDGAAAAQFLNQLSSLLADPGQLLIRLR